MEKGNQKLFSLTHKNHKKKGLPLQPAIIFLQARTSSTRLPGKVLKTVLGKPIIAYLIDRLLTAGLEVVLLVPKSERKSFDLISKIFPGLKIFSGAKHHVLSRFYHAGLKFPASYYLRVTGDNPFTSITCLKKILVGAKKYHADIAYYKGLPYGAGVEVISTRALTLCFKNASTKSQCEHVTPWLHEKLNMYREQTGTKSIVNEINFKSQKLIFYTPKISKNYHYPNLRVTIDTPDDFNLFKGRVIKLKQLGLEYSLANLLQVFRNDS